MKRLFCAIMTLMLLLLCACGSERASDTSEESHSDSVQQIGGTAENASDNKDIWDADELFSLGNVSGDTYESELLGYGCKLKNWVFADKERISELNQWGRDTLNESIKEIIKSADNIIDMYAESLDGQCVINIQFKKATNEINSNNTSEEAIVRGAIAEAQPYYEQIGYSNLELGQTSVEMGPEQHAGISLKGNYNGSPIFVKQAVKWCGSYIAFITVTTYDSDRTDEVFEKFYKLDVSKGYDNTSSDNADSELAYYVGDIISDIDANIVELNGEGSDFRAGWITDVGIGALYHEEGDIVANMSFYSSAYEAISDVYSTEPVSIIVIGMKESSFQEMQRYIPMIIMLTHENVDATAGFDIMGETIKNGKYSNDTLYTEIDISDGEVHFIVTVGDWSKLQ